MPTPTTHIRAAAAAACVVALAVAAPARAADTSAARPWRDAVRAFAGEHFRHPAWGYSHSVRDYALARELAAADHVTLDDDVLYAAAMLHDMAAFAPWEKADADHADVAADRVAEILGATGFPMAKLERVRSAIRTHMFNREPKTPEATYLHDADALDWLGAVGVARVVALVDPAGGAPDGPAAIKMLEEYAAAAVKGVKTPAGAREMARRRPEGEAFLNALRRETENLTTL
jgi:hypothetical protein